MTDRPHPLNVVAVSGNPRPGSRTLGAAEAAARRIEELLVADAAQTTTIDLAGLAPELFAAERPATQAALRRLAGASVAVVATPVYKASYTGLLKTFLDGYGPDGLAGVVVVPLVVSGSPAHLLAGEVHLRPVLVELGAVVPTRTLTVLENELGDVSQVIDVWAQRWGGTLRRAVGLGSLAEVAR